MKRHQIREMVMICLYQYLLLKIDQDKIIENNSERLNSLKDNEFFISLFQYAIINHVAFEDKINLALVDWKFDRLGYVEQAILLLAVSELTLKETDKAVIINEAVELAKTYGDEKSFQLINGVLDNIND